jgi:hypothetical protein
LKEEKKKERERGLGLVSSLQPIAVVCSSTGFSLLFCQKKEIGGSEGECSLRFHRKEDSFAGLGLFVYHSFEVLTEIY